MADCRPGHGTPIDREKLLSISVMSRKPFTPGWSVKYPDGSLAEQADSPIAVRLEATTQDGQ